MYYNSLTIVGHHQTIIDVISTVPKANQWKLNKEIDFENKRSDGQLIPKHVGKIAESMLDWESTIADCMNLTDSERKDIVEGIYKDHPALQRYNTVLKMCIQDRRQNFCLGVLKLKDQRSLNTYMGVV